MSGELFFWTFLLETNEVDECLETNCFCLGVDFATADDGTFNEELEAERTIAGADDETGNEGTFKDDVEGLLGKVVGDLDDVGVTGNDETLGFGLVTGIVLVDDVGVTGNDGILTETEGETGSDTGITLGTGTLLVVPMGVTGNDGTLREVDGGVIGIVVEVIGFLGGDDRSSRGDVDMGDDGFGDFTIIVLVISLLLFSSICAIRSATEITSLVLIVFSSEIYEKFIWWNARYL